MKRPGGRNSDRVKGEINLGPAWFRPLPCGALFWPRHKLLVVADLHLEKGSALARQGWLVPPHDSADTLQRLEAVANDTGASTILALGDSFHDPDGPRRLEARARACLDRLFARLEIIWVTGNHDGESGASIGGKTAPEIEIEAIRFRHEALPGEMAPEVSGHFHPRLSLPVAPGRRLARRCFALAGHRLVLPAYGSYAGGLDVHSPDLVAALGARPIAILPTSRGLLRVPPERAPA